MLFASITVNAPDNMILGFASKEISDKAANSGLFPFSLKNTTGGGLSFAYLKINSP
jgi:hypothetical protein